MKGVSEACVCAPLGHCTRLYIPQDDLAVQRRGRGIRQHVAEADRLDGCCVRAQRAQNLQAACRQPLAWPRGEAHARAPFRWPGW